MLAFAVYASFPVVPLLRGALFWAQETHHDAQTIKNMTEVTIEDIRRYLNLSGAKNDQVWSDLRVCSLLPYRFFHYS